MPLAASLESRRVETGASAAAGATCRKDAATAGLACRICGRVAERPELEEFGSARGNTSRFAARSFRLWQCPECRTIHAMEPVDFADIYRDYPPNRRRLDPFARGTLANLLGRLRAAGLRRTDSILDMGCGNGIFVDYLRSRGCVGAAGYDPYVSEFSRPVAGRFDCVVANDVVEHAPDPQGFIRECLAFLKPGGLLYVGTCDAGGVRMGELDPHLMRLHLPFHRTIFTEESLHLLGRRAGLREVRSWRRSYMDTWRPFANYRFLDEFNRALGHEMDRAFEPRAARALFRRPALLFWALLGRLFPSAAEPAVAWRKDRQSCV